MRDATLHTGQTKSDGFKAFILGRVPKFGNERMLTVAGQPHRGFERREQAVKYALEKYPSAGALATWAATAKGNGQFISEAKKKDLRLEPVFPDAPTGPTMPLVDKVPTGTKGRGKRAEPDSEEKIAEDAAAQLRAEPGIAGELRASLTVMERTKKLVQNGTGKDAKTPDLHPLASAPVSVVLDDAQEELALRKFASAADLLSKYLRHARRIKLLEAERDSMWAELVATFGSEDLARAMVERAGSVVGAWNTTVAAKS